MSATIVKPTTLDTKLIHFGEPIANSHGGKSVKVGYSNEDKLLIQAPAMVIPWDLTKEEYKKDGAVGKDGKSVPSGLKYSFQLSFRGIDGNDPAAKRIKSFHDMINKIETHLVDKASENSVMWLKMKAPPRPVIEALINSTIKVSKDANTQEPDGKYPDSIKIRVPYYTKDNNLGCQIFDKEGHDLTQDVAVLNKFRKGTHMVCILECGGVYFSNGKFGLTWSLYQGVIKSETLGRIPKGVCLITDSDDDEEEEVAPSHKPAVSKVVFTKNIVNDDDDSDELDGNSESSNPPKINVVQPAEAVGQKKIIRKTVVKTK